MKRSSKQEKILYMDSLYPNFGSGALSGETAPWSPVFALVEGGAQSGVILQYAQGHAPAGGDAEPTSAVDSAPLLTVH